MITLSMMNQYALDNNLGDDTDVFSILSQMQLEYREGKDLRMASSTLPSSSTAPGVEYSTQDVLDLFST